MDARQHVIKTAPIKLLLVVVSMLGVSCGAKQSAMKSVVAAEPGPSLSSTNLLRGNRSTVLAVSFLEERIKEDPDDIVALNKLSNYYLQLHRETEEVEYLNLALKAAQSSLRAVPSDQNPGGLRALAQSEYETHDFVGARNHAHELTEFEPRRSFGFHLLGDSQLELGEYGKARAAYEKAASLESYTVEIESRLARMSWLHGDVATALTRYANALAAAKTASVPQPETIAWCHWKLGELRAAKGNHRLSARHYSRAIDAVPGYPHAVASLAKLRAAQGDLPGAIKALEKVTANHADPEDAAAMGDLYKLSGREDDAKDQYARVEALGGQTGLPARLYNRQLVLFWANHDVHTEEAYSRAKQEYQIRRDIYAADAFAWAALKAGKLDEARNAIKDALRLGTKDAKLWYHAGMIARATGDRAEAIVYLKRALGLDRSFDPLQASLAVKALNELQSSN